MQGPHDEVGNWSANFPSRYITGDKANGLLRVGEVMDNCFTVSREGFGDSIGYPLKGRKQDLFNAGGLPLLFLFQESTLVLGVGKDLKRVN